MAIIIPIGVDTSGLRKLNTASGKLRAFGKIAAVAAGAAALGGLVKTLQVGTAEFMENQKVVAQTNAVLKSTRGIAKVTGAEIESLAESLMMKSGVDDEAIQSGQNLLLTFTRIRNETGKGNDIFNQATQATLDLSVAMGKDMTSSAILVGKALNDPVRGATALTRAGIQLTEAQKDQITAFVESGRVLEAQKIILAELNTQFGGSAEAAGKTLPGQLNILKQTFNNLAGDLVSRFMPSIARAATALVGFIQRFADAPTLTAKVEVITGSIEGVFNRIKTWWSTGERKELPARVEISPPGKRQLDNLIRDLVTELDARMEVEATRLGRSMVRGIFGGGKQEARETGEGFGNSILMSLVINVPAFKAGKRLVESLWAGVTQGLKETDFSAFSTWLNGIATFISPLGAQLGRDLAGRIQGGARGRKAVAGLANAITATVREAIQSARGSLTGLGAGLGGLVSEIIGGTSPEAKRLREIRAQQAREAREREDARLREAVANAETAEERAAAEQDLQDFLLEQEAIRLEESIQNQQDAANRSIADLVESFNRGLISADEFSMRLDGIIGANRGEELGIAFAGAFNRELQTILNTARDIFSVIGTGEAIAAGGAGIVSDVLKGENQRRFDEALSEWQTRKQRLDDQLKTALDRARGDDSPGGKKITDAEKKQIDKIRATIEQHQKRKPNRGAYGLAMGGILKQPTFVAGEAGKEAVIPLESASAANLLRDALGGGGGSSQVINLTVNAGLGTNPDELSRVIVDSIKYYERRNSRVFAGKLVPRTQNAQGVTTVDSAATTFNRVQPASSRF